MLSYHNRLHRDADIRSVLRTGQRLRVASCSAAILVTNTNTPARICVIVGRRVHPLAVRRHKLQRWLREFGRQLVRDYPNGYDMVIVAQPPITHVRTLTDLITACQPILQEMKRSLC